MIICGHLLKTEPLSHFDSFTARLAPVDNMQGGKTSAFTVESLISKESFAETRSDDTHGCMTLPRCSSGDDIARSSPSFSGAINIPRPLALEGAGAGHTSAFSQTSQLSLSTGRSFNIQRNSEHHPGKVAELKTCYKLESANLIWFPLRSRYFIVFKRSNPLYDVIVNKLKRK